jgi:5'-nucleotidase
MNILITNDDGIESASLPLLIRALVHDGHRVIAIVPDRERSGASHSITLSKPLRLTPVRKDVFMLDGTPTDCVNILMLKGIRAPRPDLVISGINRGANLSEDVFYSGTVAGAREAALFGLPALAVSLDTVKPAPDFRPVISFVQKFIRKNRLAPGTLLNINAPEGRVKGVKFTCLGSRKYKDVLIARKDPWGNPYFWLRGQGITYRKKKDSDYFETRNGYISITPMALDMTDHAVLSGLRNRTGGNNG